MITGTVKMCLMHSKLFMSYYFIHCWNIFVCFAEVGGISQDNPACDWWSFGALLYELLTGRVSYLKTYLSVKHNDTVCTYYVVPISTSKN